METFEERIRQAAPTAEEAAERRWCFVAYDRLTDETGPLSRLEPDQAGVVLVESGAYLRQRLYHKKKLVLLLALQRHFALEQAERGVRVVYARTAGSFADGLEEACRRHGLPKLRTMEPAERELRLDLEDAARRGVAVDLEPDTTWLSTVEDFERVYGKPGAGPVSKHYVMDRFYRAMRQQTGLLMRGGKPEGGQFSFDAENRKPYRGQPAVPVRPGYAPDAVTAEVIALVEQEFRNHFGRAEGWALPVRKADIDAAWRWTLEHLLPVFGPFEDAMAQAEPDMFHSRMSAFVNTSRLLPATVVADVVEAAGKGLIPLASAEGFLRQLLGWREFMRHVHRVTDGYRNVAAASQPKPRQGKGASQQQEESARPSALGASLKLPAVYWGVPSGLNCLDTVVRQVVDEGWSHHITRLMVLSNFATLCGYSPRELTDWFWVGYIDAYDWVVESNVLGMSTYGDGGITATKPYVSGAAYIHKMSDYCGGCRYNPKQALGEQACPFTALYWSFLERNEALLGRNPRMAMPYNTMRKKPAEERRALRERAEALVEQLERVKY